MMTTFRPTTNTDTSKASKAKSSKAGKAKSSKAGKGAKSSKAGGIVPTLSPTKDPTTYSPTFLPTEVPTPVSRIKISMFHDDDLTHAADISKWVSNTHLISKSSHMYVCLCVFCFDSFLWMIYSLDFNRMVSASLPHLGRPARPSTTASKRIPFRKSRGGP